MTEFQLPEELPELSCAEVAELLSALAKRQYIGSVKYGLLLAHIFMC